MHSDAATDSDENNGAFQPSQSSDFHPRCMHVNLFLCASQTLCLLCFRWDPVMTDILLFQLDFTLLHNHHHLSLNTDVGQ